jgi:hypothetical protein
MSERSDNELIIYNKMNHVIALPGMDLGTGIRNVMQKWAKDIKDALMKVDIFCDEDTPDYVQAECGIENGGLIAVGLILPSVTVGASDAAKVANLEDETWWSDGVAESPQTHWFILNTRGSKAADTFTEEEGFGLNSTEITGADQSWTFESLNVFDNADFVGAVNQRRRWHAVFVTAGVKDGGYIAHYQENVNFRGSLILDQDIKSRQRWSWEARSSTNATPSLPFIAPASIFVEA